MTPLYHQRRARATKGPGAPAAISNSYSLTDDFERSDPVTAEERKPGYSWKRRVGPARDAGLSDEVGRIVKEFEG